ncbi:hypothetical protein LTR49_022379 [Elasticomyces elasticus]|nr:hypothetical protein LTR49_022379 [Elasticomyces elasticus]
MAFPAVETKMEEPDPKVSVLGKRKHDTDTNDENEVNEADDGVYDPEDDSHDTLLQLMDLDNGNDGDEDELDDDRADENAADDDEDGARHIHMESSEAFPGCAIYDKDIPAIKKTMMSIPKKAEEVLTGQDCNGKHSKIHMSAATALLDIPTAKRPKIALIGNAAVALNAVVDMLNLAKSSCTSVPTAFSNAPPNRNKQFGAVVLYHKSAEVQGLLAAFVTDFETDEFEQDPDWDAETRQMFHRRAVNALKKLHVLFRDQEEFATVDSTREYLRSNYEDKSTNARYKMVASCEEKLKDKIIVDGSCAECCQALSRVQ